MEAGGGGSAARRGDDQAGPTTIRWKPNEECLQLLMGMGIDRNTAIKVRTYVPVLFNSIYKKSLRLVT